MSLKKALLLLRCSARARSEISMATYPVNFLRIHFPNEKVFIRTGHEKYYNEIKCQTSLTKTPILRSSDPIKSKARTVWNLKEREKGRERIYSKKQIKNDYIFIASLPWNLGKRKDAEIDRMYVSRHVCDLVRQRILYR